VITVQNRSFVLFQVFRDLNSQLELRQEAAPAAESLRSAS
jgi:hypothetical protein